MSSHTTRTPSTCGNRWDIVHRCESRPGHAGKHRCWCRSVPRREQPGYGIRMPARTRWRLARQARRRDARRAAETRQRAFLVTHFVEGVLNMPLTPWQKAILTSA